MPLKSTIMSLTVSVYLFLSMNVVTVYSAGGQTPGGACPSGELCNPLKSQSIEEFLMKIIDVLLIFALPIIVLFIMYAGFLFVTAKGDTAQIEKARTALLWSVVGGVIVLGAKVIFEVIKGTITTL